MNTITDPGKACVTANILWDQKKIENERSFQIDQYVYSNSTDIDQKITATCGKGFEKQVCHSFEFSNETSVPMGASFTLSGVVGVDKEVSTTFTVTKGTSESFTMSKNAELSKPVKAPPHSDVTVHFMCKEVTISVPVELKLVQGNKTVTEIGTYRCQSGTETYIDLRIRTIKTLV